MASHVSCGLCGKASSVRTFPSGSGTDFTLLAFRGLGKKRGFEVASRQSGLDDSRLCLGVKPKLLSLLSVFVQRGYVNASELAGILNRSLGPKKHDVEYYEMEI